MKLYIILLLILNILIVFAAVFTACWFNNINLLWILMIPALSILFTDYKEIRGDSDDEEKK